ncbi:MAG TPA: sulfatase-like hydrolase/transferase [Rhabdochlamydiaceae bacterium]|nr:sulfatase-like hydrolase/transferase [Rhabdochlamydiaceae bacterium]
MATIKRVFSRVQINYVYFGLLFVILSFIHGYHASLIENGSFIFKWYFIAYAISQSLLEVLLLAILSEWINWFFPKVAHYCFISFTFILCFAHFIDFFLVRLMDISFWNALSFVMDESLANFKELLYATHVSIAIWLMGAILGITLLLFGLLFFHFTEKIAQKKTLFIKTSHSLVIFCALPFLFLLSDRIMQHFISSGMYLDYQKVLPLKDTFISSKAGIISLPSYLKEPEKEEKVLAAINSRDFSQKEKPDIYIFIIESLREDFLTGEVAPNLNRFKNENLSTPLALSSANGTQLSWFSIFYSKFPFYFSKIKSPEWSSGSPALQILKKMGYSIDVLSSVRLSYYQMDKLIFGEKEKLAKFSYFFPFGNATKAYESDQKAMAKLIQLSTEKESGGRCFIVFLESTHFGYSWPTKSFSRFEPTIDEINYLSILFSKNDLEKIKNRYRNSIYFLDSLFGKFTESLKENGSWENAVVVVTGDHGEEFYEQGHLFHASNLSKMQTSVPIYYKLGKNLNITPAEMGSHIDIFPTIFHYLLKDQQLFSDFFDGESIFCENKFPYAFSARFNAGRSPYEMLIHNGKYKLLTRFFDKKRVFQSDKLEILDAKDNSDLSISYSLDKVQNDFSPAFKKICTP